MEEQPATLQGVTVAEAAVILGVSTATVHRMLKRGELKGQRVLRPPGTAFVVMLAEHASGDGQNAADTRHETGVTPRDNVSTGAQLAAGSETVLGPVVAALERSQATVKEQAETIGRQSAELERAASTIVTLNATLEARPAPQSTEPADRPLRLWQPWWAILADVVVALVLVVALLAWPQ
jgi:excisionase family DNA binding protein